MPITSSTVRMRRVAALWLAISMCDGPTLPAIGPFNMARSPFREGWRGPGRDTEISSVPTGEVLGGIDPAQARESFQRRPIAAGEFAQPRKRRAAAARTRGADGSSPAFMQARSSHPISRQRASSSSGARPFVARASMRRDTRDIASIVASVSSGSTSPSACAQARSSKTRSRPRRSKDSGVHAGQVGTQDVAVRGAALVEHAADVRERQAEVAQSANAVEASQVVLVVEPLSTFRPGRGRGAARCAVMVKGAHRQSGGIRQLAHPPASSARLSFPHTRRSVQPDVASGASARALRRAVRSGRGPLSPRSLHHPPECLVLHVRLGVGLRHGVGLYRPRGRTVQTGYRRALRGSNVEAERSSRRVGGGGVSAALHGVHPCDVTGTPGSARGCNAPSHARFPALLLSLRNASALRHGRSTGTWRAHASFS